MAAEISFQESNQENSRSLGEEFPVINPTMDGCGQQSYNDFRKVVLHRHLKVISMKAIISVISCKQNGIHFFSCLFPVS